MPYLMNTYKKLQVAFIKGEGVWLWDNKGKKYLDATSSLGVCGLGHSHSKITAALVEQATQLVHTSNRYQIPNQEALALKVCQLSGMSSAFFCNGGAEANEAAIKLARLYGNERCIENPQIVVMSHAFHGCTLATLAASGIRQVQAGFEPLTQGFIRAPYGDFPALSHIAQHNPHIVAILLEPIQVEGGVLIPPNTYLHEIRELSEKRQWLMMLDEMQTGIGRTGTWFCYQRSGILPDVATFAHGLGNGFPVTACLAKGVAADLFKPGQHGATFGGNPLATRVASAVIETIESENLLPEIVRKGELLLKLLAAGLKDNALVTAIRGKGLLIGIELQDPCQHLVEEAIAQGLLIEVIEKRVIRLSPPYIISEAEIRELANTLIRLISGC